MWGSYPQFYMVQISGAILDDVKSINLGSVYESVVASELAAHGHRLFYYDNRKPR